MNALEAYFKDNAEDNLSKLAERIHRAPSSLTRPLRGERNASMSLARDVERGTAGKVTASQFIDLCLEAQKRQAPSDIPRPAPSEAQGAQ